MINDIFAAVQSKECTIDTLRKIAIEQPQALNSVRGECEYIKTPLLLALACKRRSNFIEELLKLGADIKVLNSLKIPAFRLILHYYINTDVVEILNLLLKYGADINIGRLSPLSVALMRIKGESLIKTLQLLLENGVRVDKNKEPCVSLLYQTIQYVNPSNFVEVSKLLLEFGAKPARDHFSHYNKYMRKRHINPNYVGLVKILLAYSIVNEFKLKLSKVKKNIVDKRYNEIFDLSPFLLKNCYNDLISYRNALIFEISQMMQDKIDNKSSLFSFISVRCSSGLQYDENEELALCKVLSKLYSKDYSCCNDLLYASVKRNAVLPVLCKQCIYVSKSNSKSLNNDAKIILNDYVIFHLASFLNRKDIINLALAFWTSSEPRHIIATQKSLHKQTSKKFIESSTRFSKRLKIDN